ncbi:MAG: hypothetical protein ACR2RV_19280, partial [Verrucomicrobiales bacterium]
YYASLSSRDRQVVDSTTRLSRSTIARKALLHDGFIDRLGADYQLRFVRFARTAEGFDPAAWLGSDQLPPTMTDAGRFRSSTDVTAALGFALEEIPADKLAGILLLSDGRHTGEQPIEDVARRLGLQGSPVGAIPIGSDFGPRDAGILALRVPDTIYLDDRAILQADLKLDGLEGETVTVSLFNGEEFLESKAIEVGSSNLRTNARFAYTPRELGISKFAIELDRSPGEAFFENNRWEVEVAVTDDRTNVLIVDSFPRWEFRYLRNLFHARDRSVNLQYVLTDPDRIADSPPAEEVPASADRNFGESEATTIPKDLEEWMKFDAIILGDVAPETFDRTTWEHIRHCVSERAALLVTIAGPRFMPHAHFDPIFKALSPVGYAESAAPVLAGPEATYRLRLTPAGRNSLIMQQSPDPDLSEMVWQSLPPLHWRHPVTGLKAGAEVLAFAQPAGGGRNRGDSAEFRSANALIVTQRFGSGRVLALNFDRTWRLRYGVGDIYHHKFWGQILRWGTGEILRAGNRTLRLGTDRLSYEPGEEIRVTARVISTRDRPPPPAGVSAMVSRDGQLIAAETLSLRPDSNGIYEAILPPPPDAGRYELRATIGGSSETINDDPATLVMTEFVVEPGRNAIELAELSADRAFLSRLAALSGGAVADPDQAAALRRIFAPPGQIVRETTETSLWDKFPILLVLLGLLTCEWIMRRKSGLA